MGMLRCSVVLALLSLALLVAPSSDARVVTLGLRELPKAKTFVACRLDCPFGFTVAQAYPAELNSAPAAGIITSWRVVGEGGEISLQVLERAAPGGWRGAGVTSPAADSEGGSNPTYLPIGPGDLIGTDLIPNGGYVGLVTPSTAEYFEWDEPPLGETAGRTPNYQTQGALELSAEVELTPVITSVSPASGSAGGGNTVTITGKYLDSVVNVVFGSTPAISFKVDQSGEHITAVAPPSTAGTVAVRVSALHSTSEPVAGDSYTFVAPVTTTTPSPTQSGSGAPQGRASPVVVSGFSESAGRWRLGGSLPHISSVPVGTTFAFHLNAPANVALTFTQLVPGRRVGGRCVAATDRNRSGPKCKRAVIAGSLPVAAHSGLDKVNFQGRLSHSKKLRPGNYTATISTRDGSGLTTLARPLTFTIVP